MFSQSSIPEVFLKLRERESEVYQKGFSGSRIKLLRESTLFWVMRFNYMVTFIYSIIGNVNIINEFFWSLYFYPQSTYWLTHWLTLWLTHWYVHIKKDKGDKGGKIILWLNSYMTRVVLALFVILKCNSNF